MTRLPRQERALTVSPPRPRMRNSLRGAGGDREQGRTPLDPFLRNTYGVTAARPVLWLRSRSHRHCGGRSYELARNPDPLRDTVVARHDPCTLTRSSCHTRYASPRRENINRYSVCVQVSSLLNSFEKLCRRN